MTIKPTRRQVLQAGLVVPAGLYFGVKEDPEARVTKALPSLFEKVKLETCSNLL